MSTGPYGRQWISPLASTAFSPALLLADRCCIRGDTTKALELYHSEANANPIAKRRLRIAQKQIKKGIYNNTSSDGIHCIFLGFLDWYSGFESDIDFIVGLFTGAGLHVSVVDPEKADILVVGCYGSTIINEPTLSLDKLVIFISGENICPSYHIHDFSITTRTRTYCGKNVRLPQWLGEISFHADRLEYKQYARYKFKPTYSRDFTISAVYNNSTPEREEVLSLLRDSFGCDNIHVFGSQRTEEVNKFEVLSRSVINLCFENSLGDGYTTEKLFHARMMGCKALYWGDSHYSEDFSLEGVLNIRELNSDQGIISWCKEQLESVTPPPIRWNVLDSSIFAKAPTYNPIYENVVNWANIILSWRFFK